MNLNAFYKFSYGFYIVSTWNQEKPTGCIVNSVMQITAEPPTIAVSMNHDNFTHKCMEETGKFAINILAEKTDSKLIGKFGFQSGRKSDKFASVEYREEAGLPIIQASCAYAVCEIIDKWETDTHTVFLGKVIEAETINEETPMTYSYYRQVIKGSSPKAAPTYIPVK